MPIETATIKCKSIFSDDSQHRYYLQKVWDKSKPLVNVISISPSEDYNVATDLTTQLITNNVYKLGNYGGFILTNIISKVGLDIKKLKSTDKLWDSQTDKYIIEAAENSSAVIWAVGKLSQTRKVFLKREQEVLEILKESNCTDKLFMISDNKREFLHPLTPSVRQGWILNPIKS